VRILATQFWSSRGTAHTAARAVKKVKEMQ